MKSKKKDQTNQLEEVIGWIGTILVIGAYGLSSFKVLEMGMLYQGMNIIGSIAIAYISLRKKTYQPGVLNIIWALIAAVSLISLLI